MEAGTCLRCGKPYEPEDTVCYSCGAPIGETKTPTQPIRSVRTPQQAVSPPEAAAVEAAAEESRPRPPRVSVTTVPRPSTGRGNKRLWLALGITLLALVATGGGFYLARGLTAPPPVTSQTTYQDPQHRFTFQQPTLWTTVTTADGVRLSDSDGSSTAVITVQETSTPETATSYADAQAAQMGLGVAPPQQIGGVLWEQRQGRVTDPTDGAVHQVLLFVTVHDALVYSITFTSPIASYAQINTIVYQPLLASFRFEN
jgi:hypothetical protein